jgi:hypothetical protein
MNKFDALKIFQAWPPEWQRLCAEYWIETGEVDPKFVLAFPKQTAGELAQRDPIPMPAYQPKAAKVAAIPRDIQERICNGESVFLARNESHLSDFNSAMANAKASGKPAAKVANRKHHSKLVWSAAESEYLLRLASEDKPLWNVVAFFLSRYPGRSRDAVRRRVWGIRSGKPESKVKY